MSSAVDFTPRPIHIHLQRGGAEHVRGVLASVDPRAEGTAKVFMWVPLPIVVVPWKYVLEKYVLNRK